MSGDIDDNNNDGGGGIISYVVVVFINIMRSLAKSSTLFIYTITKIFSKYICLYICTQIFSLCYVK